MGNPPRRYAAYLLRLWQVGDGKDSTWRASLETPPASEAQVFAGLPELFAFLENVACGTGEEGSIPGEAVQGVEFRE
jgi:hypothetical protein